MYEVGPNTACWPVRSNSSGSEDQAVQVKDLENYTRSNRLMSMGGSAGDLPIGAVINMAPRLAAVAALRTPSFCNALGRPSHA